MLEFYINLENLILRLKFWISVNFCALTLKYKNDNYILKCIFKIKEVLGIEILLFLHIIKTKSYLFFIVCKITLVIII